MMKAMKQPRIGTGLLSVCRKMSIILYHAEFRNDALQILICESVFSTG